MTKKHYCIAAVLFVLTLLALPLDRMLAQSINRESVPGELQALLNRAETFGHGYGVFFIIVTVWILTRCHFKKLMPLIACSLGAGLMADLIKLCVGRMRPYAAPEDLSVSTFTGVFPWWQTESIRETFTHAHQSFPSAHTATAFGLAAGLAYMYPRGERWFYLLASLVAMQRLVSGAHYMSDLLFGACVGMCVAADMLGYIAERQAIAEEIANEQKLKSAQNRLAA